MLLGEDGVRLANVQAANPDLQALRGQMPEMRLPVIANRTGTPPARRLPPATSSLRPNAGQPVTASHGPANASRHRRVHRVEDNDLYSVSRWATDAPMICKRSVLLHLDWYNAELHLIRFMEICTHNVVRLLHRLLLSACACCRRLVKTSGMLKQKSWNASKGSILLCELVMWTGNISSHLRCSTGRRKQWKRSEMHIKESFLTSGCLCFSTVDDDSASIDTSLSALQLLQIS